MTTDADSVFKALADTHRRALLDQLYAHNGQTLGQLCEGSAMSRQGLTKHLAVLERANLVVIVWRGREKLHYLNPAPIQQIHARWLGKFDHHRLEALVAIEQALEDSNDD